MNFLDLKMNVEEFVAHSGNVNCLRIGKKACRLLLTGGDDQKVNLWAIGKPSSLMSLCGHTSAVESLAFDSAEVLVLGGASAGAIKLWDLEEAKMVRTLTGHRSGCTAVEFHPFGEFFASGSTDTNLKIWDIRKKGCIHTYKGHTRGISTIRFTPDGRWVVSGGSDNVVKVWDLTAGKLLHDFNFHEGPISSLDFHPLEFLLATGSADRTVKFWDLETFELIGSTRPEATGVHAINFHPDGRTLFCGFDDSLKVYSWEPIIRHDAVDMGWSTLGDLCINDGKLLGCSSYRNSVGVWVTDLSHIEPYGAPVVPDKNDCTEKICNPQESHSLEKVGSGLRSTTGLRCESPDYDMREIKTIYVDSSGGNPVASQKLGSLNSPKVEVPKEISDLKTDLQSPGIRMQVKSNEQALDKTFIVPNIVPQESPAGKDSSNSGRESITFSKTKPGMLLRPAHARKPSQNKIDSERLSTAIESVSFSNVKTESDAVQTQIVSSDGARKSCEEKDSSIKSVTEKLRPSKEENSNESIDGSKGTNPVTIVKGVAVVPGRTRTLVERFEKRETINTNEDQATKTIIPDAKCTSNEDQASNITPHTRISSNEDQAINVTPLVRLKSNADQATDFTSHMRSNSVVDQATTVTPLVRLESNSDLATDFTSHMRSNSVANQATTVTPLLRSNCTQDQVTNVTHHMRSRSTADQVIDVTPDVRCYRTEDKVTSITPHMSFTSSSDQATDTTPVRYKRNEDRSTPITPHARFTSAADQATDTTPPVRFKKNEDRAATITPHTRFTSAVDQATDTNPPVRFKKNEDRATTITAHTRCTSTAHQATDTNPPVRFKKNEDRAAIITPHMRFTSTADQATDTTPPVRFKKNEDRAATITPHTRFTNTADQATDTSPPVRYKKNEDRATTISPRTRFTRTADQATDTSPPVRHRKNGDRATTISPHMRFSSTADRATDTTPHMRFKKNEDQATTITPQMICDAGERPTVLKGEPQISGRDTTSANDAEAIENLMQTHDVFLSSLRSRLTKLQVVRHFWEINDVKGAISAMRKLPDHSVQADVISVLMEKMEILSLDVFSCLLPVLLGLLDSKMDRHVSISLEMLLKLVAVFGSVIRSTVSAPPVMGVDLQAEQRRECCKQCFIQLQKVQKTLPELVRRGGLMARGALELNLVLQQS
ncbi:hypothetical protein Ddye_019355 [Dipteronia dyeriana]|uniref:Katanin p80 WD40 repeat-containing subunit B1 homolog n=1 Tax=Dipteronia dyeriana TaxID=168575 RepID=A0AAD9WVY4_9ROSI|nr:hypothetical protein Ddye_019355 [Dipteronia dyeriana]